MNIRGLIPLFAAALGLTPVFLKWINDRSTAAASHRAIQHAKEQVEFWQVWLQAQREVSTDDRFADLKTDVAQRLDQLMLMQNGLAAPSKSSTQLERGPTLIQRLLLAYFPHTATGWTLHTMFYLTVSFAAMFVIGSAIPTDDTNANPSWEHLKGQLGFVILALLVFAFIAFVLQQFANRAERRYLTSVRESRQVGAS